MGMFDHIRCKYPLPRPEMADWEFQTKDTEPKILENFEIRVDGSLWMEEFDVNYDADPPDVTHKRWVGVDFSGAINFYDYRKGEDPVWWEFQAVFKDGQLIMLLQKAPTKLDADIT